MCKMIELLHTVFLRSDAVATIFFCCLLFEGGVYFFGKPPDIYIRRLDKVHTSEMVTIARRCQ